MIDYASTGKIAGVSGESNLTVAQAGKEAMKRDGKLKYGTTMCGNTISTFITPPRSCPDNDAYLQ